MSNRYVWGRERVSYGLYSLGAVYDNFINATDSTYFYASNYSLNRDTGEITFSTTVQGGTFPRYGKTGTYTSKLPNGVLDWSHVYWVCETPSIGEVYIAEITPLNSNAQEHYWEWEATTSSGLGGLLVDFYYAYRIDGSQTNEDRDWLGVRQSKTPAGTVSNSASSTYPPNDTQPRIASICVIPALLRRCKYVE